MKQGKLLIFVNNTAYDWRQTYRHSKEWVYWNLPERVRADKTVSIYVEWETGIFYTEGDKLGESVYSMEGTTDTFLIQARKATKDVIMLVYFENLNTDSMKNGGPAQMILNPDGYFTLILSGVHGDYILHNWEDSKGIMDYLHVLSNNSDQKSMNLMAEDYNAENAHWEKETRNVSNISQLHFPGDKKWETCLVEVRGTRRNQRFSIVIKVDGRVLTKQEFSLEKDEIRIIERNIHRNCSIDVTGQLMVNGSLTAGGYVYVTCTYNPMEQFKSKSVTWNAFTEEMSSIDNLCLYDSQLWEKCEIFIQGYENRNTGCMITLISNGEINNNGIIDWMELMDTQSETFSFQINQKVSLVVAGYISNSSLIGAGAKLTLMGFYK